MTCSKGTDRSRVRLFYYDIQSGSLVLIDNTYSDYNNLIGQYSVYPVTYDQLISLTNDYLSGYEPDERVKEKKA